MVRKKSSQEMILRLDNFSGGINTFVNPVLLNNQIPDATNIIFDEPVGIAKKMFGWSIFNSNEFVNKIPIKSIEYCKSTGENFLVVCVKDEITNKYEVFYSKEGIGNWIQITQAVSISPFDFAILDDILWICNNVSTPIVFNGLETKLLNGQGVDWDNNPIANFTLPLGLTPGKFIKVYQNRIVMANTIENGSEIIFSRFVDDDGNLIKATTSKAWTNINQILVSPEDGEEITAIYPYLSMLCVFKDNSLYIISGDLINPSIIRIPTSKGCVDYNSIQEVNNMLIYLSDDGIYAFNGREVVLLSKDIDTYFKDISTETYRGVIKNIRISTTQEFQSSQVSINNFRILGSAENSLSSPPNFVLKNSNDFYNQRYYSEKILFSDGIQLDYSTPSVTFEFEKIQGETVEGTINNVYDNNYDTFLKVRSFGQSSLALNMSKYVDFRIKIQFAQQVFLKNFTIKYHIVSRTTGGNKNGGSAGLGYYIGSEYKVIDLINVNQNRDITIKTINVGLNVNSIELKCFSSAFTNYILPLMGYLDATAEVTIYEIALNYTVAREGSGYYITNWIDTEKTSNFGFSTLEIQSETPSGTSINIYYTQSDTPVNIDENTTWVPITSGQIPNITKRYYAYKIVLNTTDVYNTPILRILKQNFNAYSEWVGMKTLSLPPTRWLNFYCSYNTNGGEIHFYLSKDNINYIEVSNEDNISTILSGSNVVYIKITSNRAGDDKTPQIFAIFLTYQLGEIIQTVFLSSAEFENRYILKLPDKIIMLNKTGVWSKIDISGLQCFVEFLGKLFVFINKKLYKFFDDEIFSTSCDITTKTVVLGTPLEVFLIRKIWLFFDKNSKTNSNVILEIYNGKSDTPVEKFSVFFDKTKNITNPVEINCGIKCYQFYAKLKNNNSNEDFGLLGLEFYIRPLRTLSKEE